MVIRIINRLIPAGRKKLLAVLVFIIFSLQIVSSFIISQPSEHSPQDKDATKGNKIKESTKNRANFRAILIPIAQPSK
jgi:hypothetical protein